MEITDDIVRVYDEKSEAWKFVKKDKGLEQLTVIE